MIESIIGQIVGRVALVALQRVARRAARVLLQPHTLAIGGALALLGAALPEGMRKEWISYLISWLLFLVRHLPKSWFSL